ncbi:MAG: hypothetical protein QNJ60_00145 [Xenococcaceae cyanobacterium MO_188.B19]|nr:hypothetical protein [Xenococcaceae cyanobacterium MO_188.B19]
MSPLSPHQSSVANLKGNDITAQLVGSRVKFDYCGVDRAIALLREQYAMGTVEIKVLR